MNQPPVPAFDHIFIVIMENHGYDEIIGSADAPYINQLAARYGVATNYVSVAHPSLPNYLALTGGDTFGVTTDCTDCFQQAPNLAVDRITPSGRTWRAYMESLPSPGHLGDAYPYMQKHDPFVYYDDLRTVPAQLANVVPFDQLATDLATAQSTPAFGWITPNMLHDMHDGTVAQGDTWLSSQIPALLSSPAWTQQRSLLVITWDEDDNAPGNQIATLVIADGVPAGFRSAVAYNHYSLLRTVELAWGLAPLTANDAGATVMSDFFPGGLRPQRLGAGCDTVGMIRLGTPADLAAAARVYRRASLSNAGDRGNLLAHPEYLILGPEGLAEGRTHVAEADGTVVGFATWADAAGTVELEDLFVDPGYRRRGIAAALVNRIAEVLRARGEERLEVTANPHALGFYRAAGFTDCGVAETEFGAGYRMVLAIS